MTLVLESPRASCCMTKLSWPSILSTCHCSTKRASKLAVILTPSLASLHCTINPYVVKSCRPEPNSHVPNISSDWKASSAGCTISSVWKLHACSVSGPSLAIRCRPVCSKGIISVACFCTVSRNSSIVESLCNRMRTGTVAITGPTKDSMPATGAFRPVTVAPNTTSSELV